MNYLIRYLIVFLFTLIAGKSNSQFHFGVKGGIGFNNIKESHELYAGNKNLTSFHGGLIAKIKLTEKIHLIPELQYITKGYSIDDNRVDYKVKINYLESPVLVNYELLKWLSVEAGPALAVKIKARIVSGNTKSNFIDDSIEPIDFSAVGGVRLQLIKNLSLVARYSYGLSIVEEYNPNHGPSPDPIETIKTYNKSVQLSIAYIIK